MPSPKDDGAECRMSDGQLSALCSVAKMDEVELLLHGLELGHLVDVMAVSIYRRPLVESLIFVCPKCKYMFCFGFHR